MDTKPVSLYKQDNLGKVRYWAIEAEGNTITIRYGELGGSLQTQTEVIREGLAGRSIDEQLMSRMASRINSQRNRGYTSNVETAKNNRPTNQLGLKMPMLAKKYKQVLPPNCAAQMKYDGNRCMITKQDGEVFAYSRQGKRINSIDHILYAARDIPEGTTLDGELYHHGTPLQTIRSWISRKQTESQGLVYMCYDVVSDLKYWTRLNWLLLEEFEHPIIVADTEVVDANYNITDKFRQARKNGYEGLIIRDLTKPYEDGKRSESLLKVKEWESEEFLVVNIQPSKDGWAILVCETKKGKIFRVSCHGHMEYKLEVLQEKQDYIGRRVTVEFANLTKDGVPFHPVAIAWRSKED